MGAETLEGNALIMPSRLRLTANLLAGLLACVTAYGNDPPTPQPDSPAAKNASADVIIVVGAAGEASYGEAFASWAARWQSVAETAGARSILIGEPAAESELSDRERLQQAIAALDTEAEAPVWLVLLGHGTFSQNVAKFNLRGPDVSAEDLAQWLQPLARPLVVINASSSSGPFINALSGPNRVIVTATRSGIEQNYARFGEYLSQTIGQPQWDIDHDGEVSILEAFLAAAAGVRDFYQAAGRIATEHALIDDNGDGLGTPANAFRGTRVVAQPSDSSQTVDGGLAARLSLAPAAERLPLTEQERQQRAEIEAELERLRSQRQQLSEADYQAALLPHLIRLARIYQAAEARAKESNTDEASQ